MEPPGAPAGARLFLLLLLLYGLSLLGATVVPGNRCSRLTCTIIKRQFCPPGSDDCGPCLSNHVEMYDGACVDRAKLHHDKLVDPLPDQAAIDYLATLLSKQDSGQLQAAIEGAAKQSQNELSANDLQEEPSGKNRADGLDVTMNPPSASSGAIKGSPVPKRSQMTDALLLGLVVSCTVVGLTALVVATVCWCRLKKEMKLAQKTDYSSNKMPGPPPYEKSPVDKKLAQSAQMYHYQHQKQQMLSMEKTKDEPKLPDSNTSDEETEDGDFTVYECPGLAPTGEMEVKNPLFDDSSLHHPNSKLQ